MDFKDIIDISPTIIRPSKLYGRDDAILVIKEVAKSMVRVGGLDTNLID